MRTLSLAVALFALAACGSKAPAASATPQAPAEPAAAPPADPPDPDGASGDPAPPEAPTGAFACNRSEVFGPIQLSEAQKRERYGTNARIFTDAPSTKQRPIEVCGVPASEQWLRGTACADGSRPTQRRRSGNVGSGGRCGTTIDHYVVTCPEASYDVFIDIYMCGPGESLF